MTTKEFYNTRIWKRCRYAFLQKKRFICERCGGTARIVHHKKHLNNDNVNDVSVSLDESNLEALCMECHNKEHNVYSKLLNGHKRYIESENKRKGRRFKWEADGRCTPL